MHHCTFVPVLNVRLFYKEPFRTSLPLFILFTIVFFLSFFYCFVLPDVPVCRSPKLPAAAVNYLVWKSVWLAAAVYRSEVSHSARGDCRFAFSRHSILDHTLQQGKRLLLRLILHTSLITCLSAPAYLCTTIIIHSDRWKQLLMCWARPQKVTGSSQVGPINS